MGRYTPRPSQVRDKPLNVIDVKERVKSNEIMKLAPDTTNWSSLCLVFTVPKRRVQDLFMQRLACWNLCNKLGSVTSDEIGLGVYTIGNTCSFVSTTHSNNTGLFPSYSRNSFIFSGSSLALLTRIACTPIAFASRTKSGLVIRV
jgi:hypothetical protein